MQERFDAMMNKVTEQTAQVNLLLAQSVQDRRVIDEMTAKLGEKSRIDKFEEKKQADRDVILKLEADEAAAMEALEHVRRKLTAAKEDYDKAYAYLTVPVPASTFDIRVGEESFDKSFGADLSQEALKAFRFGWRMVKETNISRRIIGWDDPVARARKLRKALTGEAEKYINAEDSMSKSWVKDDEEIMNHLATQWVNSHARELKIAEFESARQANNESLQKYMIRVQELVQMAYTNEPAEITRRRVAWKFLDGVRNVDIRASVIEKGWVINDDETKTPEEVLKIALTAQDIQTAARATGKTQDPGNVRSFSEGDEDKEPTGHNAAQQGLSKQNNYNSEGLWRCWFCTDFHHGGWRECEKRKKDNPSWTPGGDNAGQSSRGDSSSNNSRGKNKRGKSRGNKKNF